MVNYRLCTVACMKFYNCFSDLVLHEELDEKVDSTYLFFFNSLHTAPLNYMGAVLTLSGVSLLQVSMGAPELCQKLK